MTNLEQFDACNNRLEGDLSELKFLNKLVWLQLYNNNFSGEIPAEFGEFGCLEKAEMKKKERFIRSRDYHVIVNG